jgi:hypothetical protein
MFRAYLQKFAHGLSASGKAIGNNSFTRYELVKIRHCDAFSCSTYLYNVFTLSAKVPRGGTAPRVDQRKNVSQRKFWMKCGIIFI